MNMIEDEVKSSMQQTFDHLKSELKGLRSSKANPALVENVTAEPYGTPMRIKELATITTPEPRQLLITPFDPSTIQAIAKGIENANLGVRPNIDGPSIRINIPPMDEETRKKIVKECKDKGEKAKISIREVRRKSNESVRKKKVEGEIPEDQMKKEEKKIQDLTDKFCKDVDQLCAEKEKEILSV